MLEYRPSNENDIDDICKLRWLDSTRFQLRDARQYSRECCRRWINGMGGSSERLSVFLKQKFIGLIRLDNIDDINNNCCVGLDLVENERGKGLAKQIYKKILDELFFQRGMECIWLEVLETNTIAISLYKKLGFRVDGTLRNRIFRNKKYINCLSMSILRDEWEQKQL